MTVDELRERGYWIAHDETHGTIFPPDTSTRPIVVFARDARGRIRNKGDFEKIKAEVIAKATAHFVANRIRG